MPARYSRPQGVINGFHAEAPHPSIPALIHCGEQWASPNYPIHWHRHPCWELYFQIEGETEWETEPGQTHKVSEKSLLAMPPDQRHRLKPKPKCSHHYYYAAIDTSTLSKQSPEFELIWSDRSVYVVQDAERIIAPFKRLISEISILYPFQHYAIKQTIEQLILEASRLLIPQKPIPNFQLVHPIVTEIHELVMRDPSQNWNLTDLATRFGLTAKYLSELFKQHSHEGFLKFVLKQRINVACQQLRETQQPITEVGIQLGFSSSQHFATAFKKEMKQTPREYRNQHT